MSDKKIEDSLGIAPAPIEGEIVSETSAKRSVIDENSDNDYQYARENFYSVIEHGSKALEEMMDLARASEHPRAYEVVSTLMKTLVDANKDLVAMNKDRKSEQAPEEKQRVTNNNLFVGSTSELQKMLKEMRSQDDEPDDE